jgi:hypothetical protein
MRDVQNIKTFVMSENSGGTVEGTVDTQGFRFCRIICASSATQIVNTNVFVEHSDDNSTYTPIPNIVAGVDYTLSPVSNVTTKAKVIWDINLQGKKRYLKAKVGTGSGRIFLVATLMNPVDGLTTGLERGTDIYAQG